MTKAAKLPVMPMGQPMPSSKEDEAERRRWRAEDALRDIERAEEHRRDKSLMKEVKKVAKEKVKNLKSVCGDKDDN